MGPGYKHVTVTADGCHSRGPTGTSNLNPLAWHINQSLLAPVVEETLTMHRGWAPPSVSASRLPASLMWGAAAWVTHASAPAGTRTALGLPCWCLRERADAEKYWMHALGGDGWEI